jgi:hypothetical protein
MKNYLITLFSLKSQTEKTSEHFGNCPINEQTGDGEAVGRCWFSLSESGKCPRHGNVIHELDVFNKTSSLTLEENQKNKVT